MPFFTTTTARPTTQAAPPPPTRSQRTSCYLARDGYFACLDRLDRSPADKDSTSCAAEQATFEKDCVSSWVCIPFHNTPPPFSQSSMHHISLASHTHHHLLPGGGPKEKEKANLVNPGRGGWEDMDWGISCRWSTLRSAT